MRMYLSGPMTGIENYNFPEFFRIARLLRAQGFEVVSPAEFDIEQGWVVAESQPPTWKEHWTPCLARDGQPCPSPDWKHRYTATPDFDYEKALALDCEKVRQCDGIVLMPGWEASTGARRELRAALDAGKLVFSYETSCDTLEAWPAALHPVILSALTTLGNSVIPATSEGTTPGTLSVSGKQPGAATTTTTVGVPTSNASPPPVDDTASAPRLTLESLNASLDAAASAASGPTAPSTSTTATTPAESVASSAPRATAPSVPSVMTPPASGQPPRMLRTPEQHEVIGCFIDLLMAATGDGGKKRAAGSKPSWKVDEGHEGAIFSHITKWKRGERVDPDSGVHPLAHAAWRCLAIAAQESALNGLIPPAPAGADLRYPDPLF